MEVEHIEWISRTNAHQYPHWNLIGVSHFLCVPIFPLFSFSFRFEHIFHCYWCFFPIEIRSNACACASVQTYNRIGTLIRISNINIIIFINALIWREKKNVHFICTNTMEYEWSFVAREWTRGRNKTWIKHAANAKRQTNTIALLHLFTNEKFIDLSQRRQ